MSRTIRSGWTALCLAAGLLTGCLKNDSHETTLVLKPWAQENPGSAVAPLTEAKAYAFDADTTEWTVASYDDALAGIITSRQNPAQRIETPESVAEPYTYEGASGWLQMPLPAPSRMILAVDPASRLYAYTQQQSGENLPQLYVSVVFRAWKEGFSYKDGNWVFFNDFYEEPTYVDFFVTPKVQKEEDGPLSVPTNIRAYAFKADTTTWRIASYEDAAAGRLTAKKDPKLTWDTPSFDGFKQDDSYRMSVSGSPLMVVVVDRSNKRYAYCQQEVDLEGEPLIVPLVFRLWKKTYLYVEDSWRVVDQSLKPKEPENPDPETDKTLRR